MTTREHIESLIQNNSNVPMDAQIIAQFTVSELLEIDMFMNCTNETFVRIIRKLRTQNRNLMNAITQLEKAIPEDDEELNKLINSLDTIDPAKESGDKTHE